MKVFYWIGKVAVGFVVVCMSVLGLFLIPIGLIFIGVVGLGVLYWNYLKAVWTSAFKGYDNSVKK